MRTILFALLFILVNLNAQSQSLKIPDSLKEWKDWVLYGVDDLHCPISYNKSAKKLCLWYKNIRYSPQTATITLEVRNFFDKDFNAPLIVGSSGWVGGLKIDGIDAPVTENGDTPYALIPNGEHTLEFKLISKQELNYLKLPRGVVGVEVEQKGFLVGDKSQKLWLKQKKRAKSQKESLDISIYRKIIDGHPIKMETALHFRVSGKMRYIELEGILLDGFLPTSLGGGLKASITKDGKLKVELKSGEWNLLVSSFASKNLLQIKPPKYNFTPSNSEVWAFEENPKYRSVKIEGVPSIDPVQTTMPKSWKSLNSYLIKQGSSFKIVEIYKSIDGKSANHFELTRDLWLDFDGNGYSLFDTIKAKLNRATRLESIELFKLMSLSINGQPQLLSSVKKEGASGVELNLKKSEITTSARYEKNISLLPINGWNQKLDGATLNINLPPAWRILASDGSYRHSDLWIDKWDLFDIFLLLLLIIMVYRLFDLPLALLVALFGVIFWQEVEAPTIIWIFLAIFVAILRVLPLGKLRNRVMILTLLILGKLIFIIFNFGVYELRASLYPQLEKYEKKSSIFMPTLSASREDVLKSKRESMRYSVDKSYIQPTQSYPKKQNYQRAVDLDEKIQTGIAKPQWKWHSHSFYWDGTVGESDMLKIWLIPPVVTRIWRVLALIGVLFTLFIFAREIFYEYERENFPEELPKNRRDHKTALFLAFMLLFVSSPANLYSKNLYPSEVKTPSKDTLATLKKRLINEQNICKSSSCASFEKMDIEASNSTLKISIVVSAQSNLYIPTVERVDNWIATNITIDDNSSALRAVSSRREPLVFVPAGRHKLTFEGSLEEIDRVLLESKIPLRVINASSSSEYKITLGDRHFIEILRVSGEKKEKLESSIAPFIQIERVFHFQNRWYINTTFTLKNRPQNPATLEYPLLKDESILTQNIQKSGNKALIHLTKERKVVRFKSSLPITEELNLTAVESRSSLVFEEWLFDVSPVWHLEYSGVKSLGNRVVNGQLLPKFKPWSRESLGVKISKTIPKKGESLTIESSNLEIEQSINYRDLELKLKIKSASAHYYPVEIENLEDLKSVEIDGRKYFLKPEKNRLNIPIKIGSQVVTIKWREPKKVSTIYDFPTIKLDRNSTNSKIVVNFGESYILDSSRSRWILYTGGAVLSPAVLIWGVMVTVLLFAFIVTKLLGTPPTLLQWSILSLGITTVYPWILIPIVLWIGVVKFKDYRADELDGKALNFTQFLIVFLAVVTLFVILFSIMDSLLSSPDTMIRGNGSHNSMLIWYYDFIGQELPKPILISLSGFSYKLLMLVWSIWASFTLISWAETAWRAFSKGKIWAKKEKRKEKKE